MHVVHYKKAYGSLEAASSYSDGLAILGILIQVGF